MAKTLNLLRSQLSAFHYVSDKQKEIKAVIDVYINSDSQRANEEIINDLKEILSVELLHFDESLNGSIILFRILRDYLVLNDFGIDHIQKTRE